MGYLVILIIVAGTAFFAYRAFVSRRTWRALLSATLSREERAQIIQSVPLVQKLPPALRGALEGKINLFLHQVDFQGCDGLEVTEEMRLSIAAQACLLVVNSDHWYQHLTTVLIYPGAFKSLRAQQEGYVVHEQEIIRTGESWTRGPVILSWADAQHGALDTRDGHNVVLHEFAHQIDDLSGHTDGAPIMAEGQNYSTWERVILEAYDRHVSNVERGRSTVLDAYGATAHEEFFAVAVEVFFERPVALAADEPEVYAQLSALLNLDPKTWDQVN